MIGVKCKHSARSSNIAGDDDDCCHLADESRLACHSFRSLSRVLQDAHLCACSTHSLPQLIPVLGLQTGHGLGLMNLCLVRPPSDPYQGVWGKRRPCLLNWKQLPLSPLI